MADKSPAHAVGHTPGNAPAGRPGRAVLTSLPALGGYAESLRTALNRAQAQLACRSSVCVNRMR
jgi:hypothetical protein